MKSVVDRLDEKIQTSPKCWQWIGCRTKGGYGHFKINGKQMTAHRAVYSIMIGEIPHGYQLDHLCNNRACVNPAHLEPVTPAENNKRSTSPSALNMLKTTCPVGHTYSGKTATGKRICKLCRREATIRYRQRKRDDG